MAPSWTRNPRYLALLVVLLFGSFYLLAPFEDGVPGAPPPAAEVQTTWDHSLKSRLKRTDLVYDKTLRDRQGLIEKFGPAVEQVELFPPNVAPWPPYTVWDFFPPAFNCPHEMQRIGNLGDGGKWVCGVSRVQDKRDCVIYSVGINNESSFEAELLESTEHCEVWGYDFSVNSFGPEIPAKHIDRTHFHAYGLAGTDGVTDGHKMFTLDSLMKQNGHKHIDILKVDVEGWEFETLTTMLKPYIDAGVPLPFGQLQLEIHLWNKTFPEFLKWWEMLEEAGLRPFMTEPNLVYQNYNRASSADLAEYSFLNRKGNNVFVNDIHHN